MSRTLPVLASRLIDIRMDPSFVTSCRSPDVEAAPVELKMTQLLLYVHEDNCMSAFSVSVDVVESLEEYVKEDGLSVSANAVTELSVRLNTTP